MSGVDWARLEMSTRATDLEPGLQARIADPLWLLARQWQMGELTGEDAGSPVSATLSLQSTPLRSWLPGTSSGAPDASRQRPLSAGTPLEALVEAEPATGAMYFRLSVEAGQQLFRMLDAKNLGGYRARLRQLFRLKYSPEPGWLDAGGERRLKLLLRSALDCATLRKNIKARDAATVARAVNVATADQASFAEVLNGWLAWYDGLVVEGAAEVSAWQSHKMEYAFHAAAPGEEANVVLKADGYSDGHLDWDDFDIAPESSLRMKAEHSTKTTSSLPARVRFRGMPARRFWELEDARIYFGGLEADPLELGKLVLAEFATVYGDDWFILPATLGTGALHRVTSLIVTDTFGGATTIPPAAVRDGAARPWRFFELERDPGPAGGRAPWMLVPPALGEVPEGVELERVVLARDEQANLAWAVEEVVEDPLGRGASRPELARRTRETGGTTSEGGGGDPDVWTYRLEQDPPPWWVPLVPVQLKGKTGQFVLRRGRLAGWEHLPATALAGPRGVLLEPGRPLRILEEEVPAEGVEVVRGWQLARAADGRLVMWVGRRKRPARRTQGSNLRYDQVQRGGR